MSTIILLFRDTAIGRHNERLKIGRVVIKTTLLIRPFEDTRGLENLGPYEARVKDRVDEIVHSLDKRFASGKLTDEDVISLSTEKFRFTSYLAPLIRNLRLLDPKVAEISVMFLWQLIGAAFRSGQLAPNEKIMKELGDLQALRGTDGNKAKADARNPTLDAAIIDEAKTQNRALASSMKFAALIRPGVRARLGWKPDEKGWPSDGTIKRAISERIKKVHA